MVLATLPKKGEKKPLHYPRLDTVIKVEEVLRGADVPLSKNEIDRRLEKKIMRPTLNIILEYLKDSNKIVIIPEGILWIYNDNINSDMRKRFDKARRVM